jgi:hypothetical protein
VLSIGCRADEGDEASPGCRVALIGVVSAASREDRPKSWFRAVKRAGRFSAVGIGVDGDGGHQVEKEGLLPLREHLP